MRVDDVSIWRIGSYLAFPSVFSAGQVGTLNEQAWQDQVQWLADQGTVDMGSIETRLAVSGNRADGV